MNENFVTLLGLDSIGMATAIDTGVERASDRDESMRGLSNFNRMLVATNDSLSFGKVMANMLNDPSLKGKLTGDAVETAISVGKRVVNEPFFASKLDGLDGVQSVAGNEILASLLFMNINSILSSSLGKIIGNIADVEPIKGGRDNVKFKIFGQTNIAVDGMGDVSDGDVLTPLKACQPMAFAQRDFKYVTVGGTLTYTSQVEYKLGGGVGAIARGETEVTMIAPDGSETIIVNDFEVSSNTGDTYSTKVLTKAGGFVTVTIAYTTGVITVVDDGSAGVDAGYTILITTACSYNDMALITGVVGVDITEHTYVARTVALATQASFMDIRTALVTGNINLLVEGLRVVSEKIATEKIALGLSKAVARYNDTTDKYTLDISGVSGISIADRYAYITAKWGEIGKAILVESQLTDRVSIVGGSSLVQIATGLATGSGSSENGAILKDTEENAFKWIATIGDKYDCYFDPTFDTAGHDFDMYVIGSPSDPTKRASISGVGLPLMPPSDPLFNNAGTKTIRLEGKMIIDTNKEARSQKLVKSLKVTGL